MAKSLLNNANEHAVSLRNTRGETLQLQGRARTWVDSSFAASLPRGVTVRDTDAQVPPQTVSADASAEPATDAGG